MRLKFKSFSSGSCGNCYFLGLEEEEGVLSAGILIDAGVSLRRLKKELEAEHLSLDSFSAILVTHDHMDHIRSLGSYCKKLCKPVYATSTLLNALSHNTFTLDHIGAVKRLLSDDDWTEIVPGKIFARYFIVPHDATQTIGYSLMVGDRRFTIMTDIGAMTPEALYFARQSDTVVIESNYDVDMLMGGPYTYELKKRIFGGNGHLSNDACAQAIKDFRHPGLKHVFLCHLSENNNTPSLALTASTAAMKEAGIFEEVTLRALPRVTPSPLFVL